VRRLLADMVTEQSDQTCPGGGVSYFGPSSPGEIFVNGSVVCGVGDNEVIYDIGTVDANGNFIASGLNVFSQIITVLSGAPTCFQMTNDQNRPESTFSAIQSSLLLQLMDDGRNVRSLFFGVSFDVACSLSDKFAVRRWKFCVLAYFTKLHRFRDGSIERKRGI
jgi:hypothetical protein